MFKSMYTEQFTVFCLQCAVHTANTKMQGKSNRNCETTTTATTTAKKWTSNEYTNPLHVEEFEFGRPFWIFISSLHFGIAFSPLPSHKFDAASKLISCSALLRFYSSVGFFLCPKTTKCKKDTEHMELSDRRISLHSRDCHCRTFFLLHKFSSTRDFRQTVWAKESCESHGNQSACDEKQGNATHFAKCSFDVTVCNWCFLYGFPWWLSIFHDGKHLLCCLTKRQRNHSENSTSREVEAVAT